MTDDVLVVPGAVIEGDTVENPEVEEMGRAQRHHERVFAL